jgi:hypothetical protein
MGPPAPLCPTAPRGTPRGAGPPEPGPRAGARAWMPARPPALPSGRISPAGATSGWFSPPSVPERPAGRFDAISAISLRSRAHIPLLRQSRRNFPPFPANSVPTPVCQRLRTTVKVFSARRRARGFSGVVERLRSSARSRADWRLTARGTSASLDGRCGMVSRP